MFQKRVLLRETIGERVRKKRNEALKQVKQPFNYIRNEMNLRRGTSNFYSV